MKKHLLCLCSFVFLMQSCVKVSENVSDQLQKHNDSGSYSANYDRALQIAELAPKLFSGDDTKSSFKTISSVTAVLSPVGTKSHGTDTLMYLFNYAGDAGYVVVPADESKGRLLAYCDEGSFNISDTCSDALSRFLIDRMISYCESDEKVEYENEDTKAVYHNLAYHRFYGAFFDKTGPSCHRVGPPFTYDFDDRGGINRTPGYYGNYGCTAALNVVFSIGADDGRGPLLTTCWGQPYPYNLKAPLINGVNASAGCVAAAVTQIMAYYGLLWLSFGLSRP